MQLGSHFDLVPNFSCTEYCTSCSRTCKHSVVMQSHNVEAWFNIALRPRKPEGSLGRTAQDGHLDSHTAPELCGPDSICTDFCTSCTRTCKHSAVRLSLRSSYTGCCAEVSDQLVQAFHHLMQHAPNELKRENPWHLWILSRWNPRSVSTAPCCRVVQLFSLSWYPCTRKSPNALHRLPKVSLMSSLKLFQCLSDWWWPSLVLYGWYTG